jgi:putative transposase
MTGNNPIDRSILGTKRHFLIDKNGIPLSAVITPARTHDTKTVTEVMYNAGINRPISTISTTKNKVIKQHLCLDKAYNSRRVKQEIIKRGMYLLSHTRERLSSKRA